MAVPAEREGIGNGGSEYHRAEELGIRLSASTNGRPCVEQAELEQVQTIPEEASPTAGHERVEQRTHLRPIPGSILRNRESRCCSSTGPRVVKRVSMQFPTQHTQDGSNSSGSDDEHTLRVRPPTETIVELETESGEWKEKVEEMAGGAEDGTYSQHLSAVNALNAKNAFDQTEECQQETELLRHSSTTRKKRYSIRYSSLRSNRLSQSLSRLQRGQWFKAQPKKLQRLQSRLELDELAHNEQELKASLYWHIGTPVKRWKVERQVPVKLLLQLLKTFCLIVQVILFTFTIPYKRAEFLFDSRSLFESLFLVNFNPEIPLRQQVAYSIEDVRSELDFVVKNYYQIPNLTIGGYDYVNDENGQPIPLQFHLRQFRRADLFASKHSFVLDGAVEEIQFNYSQPSNVSVTELLKEQSQDPMFHKFLNMEVYIRLTNVRIEAPQKAECYQFSVQVVFENDDHNGKILYYLKETVERTSCVGKILADKTDYYLILVALIALDLIVLSLCIASVILTMKTLLRACWLGRAMGRFYREELRLPLSWWERRSLFSLWHFFNITSDVFIIFGTIYKILLELDVTIHASAARILLGSALLFQAGVILRYINYFKQFNALTRTLALAFPELLKFLLCGSVLFFAFVLCGWIVIGPFHPKFETFTSSVETLFALVNGDDLYNTYILINEQVDLLAYLYSRIFLYLFLSLFIYAVLNLFTSLIISAYEISQNKDTATLNEVRRFVFSGPLTPHGVALRDITSTSKYVDPNLILNKGKKKTNSFVEESL